VISDLSESIRLNPTNAQAYFYRGYACQIKGAFDKAADDYIKSSELDPNTSAVWDSLNSLAWQLATSPDISIRNGKKSLEVAKRACEVTMWREWRYLDTLAAAYAETGDFDNAVKYQKMVVNMQGSLKIQEQYGLTERLQLYEQKEPYHEAAKHEP
jgi:Flp pilus assembly protein TadD